MTCSNRKFTWKFCLTSVPGSHCEHKRSRDSLAFHPDKSKASLTQTFAGNAHLVISGTNFPRRLLGMSPRIKIQGLMHPCQLVTESFLPLRSHTNTMLSSIFAIPLSCSIYVWVKEEVFLEKCLITLSLKSQIIYHQGWKTPFFPMTLLQD